MKKTIILLLLFSNLFSAFELQTDNVFLSGAANSSVAQKGMFASFLLNPSASAFVDGTRLGIGYFKPFGFKGLHYAGMVGNFGWRQNGIGGAFFSFGNDLYRESAITINTSRLFIDKTFSIGINVHWYALEVKNYGSAYSFGIDAGALYEITDHFFTGFSIRNLNQPRLNGHNEEIPVVTSLGIAGVVDDHFHLSIAIQKDGRFPPAFLMGVVFLVNQSFIIQSGFSTYPAVPSVGFQFQRKRLAVHYVLKYHFELGATHFWGVSFDMPNRKE